MKWFAPDYYGEFACIAGKCCHSCCIGWEIDIDEDTLEYYRSVPGEIGKKLRKNIDETDDGAHFRLKPDERCPFLTGDGLCELILTLGKDSLCQICDDHPRFRNFFSERTELGLGLCCEAAAGLILGWSEPVRLTELADDGEPLTGEDADFIARRDDLLARMQDRSLPIPERIRQLIGDESLPLPERTVAEWKKTFLSLERLDETWTKSLSHLDEICEKPLLSAALSDDIPDETSWEQLIVYLLYRHLAPAAEDGLWRERIALCVLSWALLRLLSRLCPEPLTELARQFSSEIEYSDENIEALLDEMY